MSEVTTVPRAQSPEDWLHEHDDDPDPSGRSGVRAGVGIETVVGGLFTLWGVVLLILLFLDVLPGAVVVAVYPKLLPWWLVSLPLLAVGSWLSFWLSDESGFDVEEEPALPRGPGSE